MGSGYTVNSEMPIHESRGSFPAKNRTAPGSALLVGDLILSMWQHRMLRHYRWERVSCLLLAPLPFIANVINLESQQAHYLCDNL